MGRNLEAEMAEQALHVAAMLIERMRAALPIQGGPPRGSGAAPVTLTVAREHDQMLTCLIVALAPFVRNLHTEITLKTPPGKPGFVTLECRWGKAETREPTADTASAHGEGI